MTLREKQAVIVVDPISSGAFLKKSAKQEGYGVIGVFTVPFDVSEAGFHGKREEFTADCDFVIQSADARAILSQLQGAPFQVKGVVAGLDSGVEMADCLAGDLGLYHNPLELSHARRDKLEMRKAIQKAALSCPAFAECSTVEKVVEFAQNRSFPIVIKTPQGAGTNHVYLCNSEEELKEKYHTIRESLDFFGQKTAFALAEEYIDGPEYIVDLFCDGEKFHVTDVWVYEKGLPGGPKNLCWSCILLKPEDVPAVVAYAIESARAVGIERGAVHAEIKDDPKRGPTLIEIAARMCGAGVPQLLKDATNFDLCRGVIQAFTEKKVDVPETISIDRHFALAFGVSFDEGTVEAIQGIEAIQKLPSYIRHALHLKQGEGCVKSVDLKTTPLVVYLGHEDKAQVLKDIEAVHRLFKVITRP